MLKRPTIRVVLSVGLVVLLGITVVGVYQIRSLQRSVRVIVELNEQESALASEMRQHMTQQFIALRDMVLRRHAATADDLKIFNSERAAYDSARAKLAKSFLSSSNTSRSEFWALQNADEMAKSAEFLSEEVLGLVAIQDFREAGNVLASKVGPGQQLWGEGLLEIERLQYLQNADEAKVAQYAISIAYAAMIAPLVLSALGMIAFIRFNVSAGIR